MNDLIELETRLNTMITNGKVLEALNEFFDEDAVFQEGTAAKRVGKKVNYEFLSGFLKSLKAFNGAKLHRQAGGKDWTFSEWTFDMVGPEGPIVWNEVIRREWKNGKVISERYYNAGA
jgi:hypothetical protein